MFVCVRVCTCVCVRVHIYTNVMQYKLLQNNECGSDRKFLRMNSYTHTYIHRYIHSYAVAELLLRVQAMLNFLFLRLVIMHQTTLGSVDQIQILEVSRSQSCYCKCRPCLKVDRLVNKLVCKHLLYMCFIREPNQDAYPCSGCEEYLP